MMMRPMMSKSVCWGDTRDEHKDWVKLVSHCGSQDEDVILPRGNLHTVAVAHRRDDGLLGHGKPHSAGAVDLHILKTVSQGRTGQCPD